MVRFFVFTCFFFVLAYSYGQAPDTLQLGEFVKTDIRFREVRKHLFTTSTDSMAHAVYPMGNVVELLQNTTPLFVRNAGPSHSASFSSRGLAAAHTAVYWKGININSPTTGLADLSLIPAGLVETMSIAYGGASALMGSGLMGGGVYLNPDQKVLPGIYGEVAFQQSNTGNTGLNLKSKLVIGPWISRTALVWNYNKNQYPFIHRAQATPERQFREHSLMEQKGISQDLKRYFGRHSVEISLWGAETERQLPPSLTSANVDENQRDINLKSLVAANLNYSRTQVQLQAGYIYDLLNYESALGIESHIRSGAAVLNADVIHQIHPRWQVLAGSRNTLQQALAESNFLEEETLINPAVYAGFNYRSLSNFLETNLVLRQDFFSNYRHAFSPALNVQLNPLSWSRIHISASRNYRIPGFNDRFWYPGGNPDLLPEDAWQLTAGPEVRLVHSETVKFQMKSEGYYNFIDNWIQWVPMGNYWGAVSYKSVQTAGVQSGLHLSVKRGNTRLNGAVEHVFVSAQNLHSDFNDNLQGSPLLHVPTHKITSQWSFLWRGISLYSDVSYTDSRVPATGQSALPAFFLANASLAYRLKLGDMGGELRLNVYNLLDTDYQVMPWMPMPLRHYSLMLKIFIHKPKNSKP